jgi:hypothetical protein
MRIQVNSGNTVGVDTVVARRVKGEVERVLARFEARLTRVEVHLSSSDPAAIRCLIEVRPRDARPVAASAVATRMTAAVSRALGKTRRALDTFFDKLGRPDAPFSVDGKKKAAKKTAAAKKATGATEIKLRSGGAKKKGIHQARRTSWRG